jgi:8-oxo-dGTP pyrophosphatase MutT (NUDIX family)
VWFYAPLRVRVRIIILVDNQVLLVKNWFGPDSWQTPGGGMKFDESVIETATRETQEEFGTVLQESSLEQLTDKPEIVKSAGLLFRYHYVVARLDTKPEYILPSEIVDAIWAPLTSVKIPVFVRRKLV